MSAHRARIIACAVLFAALACGGEETPREGAPAQPDAAALEPAPAALESEPAAVFPSAPADVLTESAVAPEPDDEANERIAAVLELDPEGAGLGELVRAAQDDASPDVREAAVIALGDSEDPRALDALIAATEDESPLVVVAAIDQLAWFEDRRAEDALRRLASSPNAEIAAAAKEELEE